MNKVVDLNQIISYLNTQIDNTIINIKKYGEEISKNEIKIKQLHQDYTNNIKNPNNILDFKYILECLITEAKEQGRLQQLLELKEVLEKAKLQNENKL